MLYHTKTPSFLQGHSNYPLAPAHAAAEKPLTKITQITGWNPPGYLSAGLFEAFPSLPVEPGSVAAGIWGYLWFVGVEHGHLHVLSPDVFRLPLHWGGRGFLVVATDANEEKEQGYGQGDGDTWNQDVQDFHFVLFLGILVIWFRKKKKTKNKGMKHPTVKRIPGSAKSVKNNKTSFLSC